MQTPLILVLVLIFPQVSMSDAARKFNWLVVTSTLEPLRVPHHYFPLDNLVSGSEDGEREKIKRREFGLSILR